MSPGTLWLTIALVAVATFVIKGIGPFVFGPSERGAGLPAPLARVVLLLAPPLLAALVVTNALADGPAVHAGADTLGVATAGVLVWRGLTVLPAVVVAAVVTAVSRLLGLS